MGVLGLELGFRGRVLNTIHGNMQIIFKLYGLHFNSYFIKLLFMAGVCIVYM